MILNLTDFYIVIVNLSYGFLAGFFFLVLNHQKRNILHDILFSFIYIYLYLKYVTKLHEIHPYLIIILIIGFIISIIYKKHFKKRIYEFRYLFSLINKLFLYLITPPIYKKLIKYIKFKHQLRRLYKQKPYLKKGKWDLF